MVLNSSRNTDVTSWTRRLALCGWIILAVFCLLIGLIGLATPIMPASPFLLAACWLICRSSPAARARIEDWKARLKQVWARRKSAA